MAAYDITLPVESVDFVPTAGEDDDEDNVTKNSKDCNDEEQDTLNIEFKNVCQEFHCKVSKT